jgi:integrase/recombinase XerD
MGLELKIAERALRGMLYFTGLRVTPICSLKVGDMSFSTTTFAEGLHVPGMIRAVSKGNKPSVKPMHLELHRLLREYLLERHPTMDSRAHLFAHKNGQPWTRKTVARLMLRWGRAAGVPDCHAHRFRHTFATDLLRQGSDIRLVQALLDHEDLSTTALHTKVTDAQTASAVLSLRGFGPEPQQQPEPTK